nr:MAG TPA: hypothetical protein [Caudoviricetes sp.]
MQYITIIYAVLLYPNLLYGSFLLVIHSHTL